LQHQTMDATQYGYFALELSTKRGTHMLKRLTLTTGFLLAAAPAFAHISPEHGSSLMAGVTHPFSGLDHILAMVSVGLWAAMSGGKAKFILPAAFVAMMLAGFGLALAGLVLPFMEPAILASVVALGLLVALAVRLPVAAGAAIVSVFALLHGNAHGIEIGHAEAAKFALGFAVSTLILHAAGLFLGMAVANSNQRLARLLGAGTTVAGLALLIG
jgi:urease accessory protein